MRFLKPFLDIRKGERGKTLGMAACFFIITAAYWFLKPLRSTLTLENLGADAIRQLKVLSAVVSVGIVAAYSIALTRLSRERLTYLVLGSFVWLLLFFFLFFTYFGVVKLIYYCFYVFLDLFIAVNLAVFWTFLADIMDPEAAKRLYGAVGAGGVIGGFVGSLSCKSAIDHVEPASMLLFVAVGYSLVIVIISLVSRRVEKLDGTPQGVISQSGQSRLHDALAGAKEVLTSRYFLAICVVLAAYELISTVNDFTFHKAVELAFRDEGNARSLLASALDLVSDATGLEARAWLENALSIEVGKGTLGAFFSEFFLLLNVLALLIQMLLTSLVIRRAGMTAALLVLPVVLLGFSTTFLVVPAFALSQALYLSDNSLNYSLNQTARELLFVPMERRQKYRALAFIDIFVQRSAKATGGFLLLLMPLLSTLDSPASLRWCMLITIPVAAAWAGTAVFLGRQFGRTSAAAVRPATAAPLPAESIGGPQLEP
jgi:AAA family ATP:ADP antiporter